MAIVLGNFTQKVTKLAGAIDIRALANRVENGSADGLREAGQALRGLQQYADSILGVVNQMREYLGNLDLLLATTTIAGGGSTTYYSSLTLSAASTEIASPVSLGSVADGAILIIRIAIDATPGRQITWKGTDFVGFSVNDIDNSANAVNHYVAYKGPSGKWEPAAIPALGRQ